MTVSDQPGAGGGSLSVLLVSSPQRPLDQGGVGRVEVYRGQRFEQVGTRPHTTRDDRTITLVIWRARCLDCEAEFETTTAAHADRRKPGARRCPAHRARRRPAWRDRVAETDPAAEARPLPDGRPIAPLAAYESDRNGRRP